MSRQTTSQSQLCHKIRCLRLPHCITFLCAIICFASISPISQVLAQNATDVEIKLAKDLLLDKDFISKFPTTVQFVFNVAGYLDQIKGLWDAAMKIKELARLDEELKSKTKALTSGEKWKKLVRAYQLSLELYITASSKAIGIIAPLVSASGLAATATSAILFEVSFVWEVQLSVLTYGINNLANAWGQYEFEIYKLIVLSEDTEWDVSKKALINDFEQRVWPKVATGNNLSYSNIPSNQYVFVWSRGTDTIRYSYFLRNNGFLNNVAQFEVSLYFYNPTRNDVNSKVFFALVDDNGTVFTKIKDTLPVWPLSLKSMISEANIRQISFPIVVPKIELSRFSNSGGVIIDFGNDEVREKVISLSVPSIQPSVMRLTQSVIKGRQTTLSFLVSGKGVGDVGEIKVDAFSVRKNNLISADNWFHQNAPFPVLLSGDSKSVSMSIDVPSTAEAGNYNGELVITGVNSGISILPITIVVKEDISIPGMISDLSGQTGGKGEISIKWSAPGADRNFGRASFYSIRYSTNSLNETNWISAIEVTQPPKPQSSGSPECYSLSGLLPGKLYYLGIKAINEANNYSQLSNVISVTAGINTAEDTVHVEEPIGVATNIYTIKFEEVKLELDDIFELAYDDDLNPINGKIGIVQWRNAGTTIQTYSSYLWDVSNTPEGNYFIVTSLRRKGSSQTVINYSKTRITISHAGNKSYEPNDNLESAWGPIESGKEYLSILSDSNDIDLYKLWPTANSHISGFLFIPMNSQYDAQVDFNSSNAYNRRSTYYPNGNYVEFSADVGNPVDGPSYVKNSSVRFGATSQYKLIVNYTPRIFTPSASPYTTNGARYQKVLAFIIGVNQWKDASKCDIQYKDGLQGEWRMFAVNVPMISAQRMLFPYGVDGHTYYFRVRGIDYAGQPGSYFESSYGIATVDLSPPTSSIDPLDSVQTESTFPVKWRGCDATSGIQSYSIQYRKNSGSWIDWLIKTTDTSATFGKNVENFMSYGDRYDFRSIAFDNAGWGETEIHSNGDAITTIKADLVPPGQISDLVCITGSDTGSIVVKWTAPGGDSKSGYCAYYDIRYSAYPISSLNWGNATMLSGIQKPLPAGNQEMCVVRYLKPGILYYFAMKAIDASGNISELSNIQSAIASSLLTTKFTFRDSVKYFPKDYHSGVVFWATNIASRGTVEYGKDSSYTNAVWDSSWAVHHTVNLMNYDSTVVYRIRIRAEDIYGRINISFGPIFKGIVPVENRFVVESKSYTLQQNYPNPFNPSTTIQYYLPVEEKVNLKVFNLLGQEIATLADEQMGAGYHKIQWCPQLIPSGVYIYRLQAGIFVEIKKMIVLK